MANGKYHIQYRFDFDPPDRWRTDLRLQGMGRDFARGAFFTLRGLAGGSTDYRLVRCNVSPHAQTPEELIEVIDTHKTGKISLNSPSSSGVPSDKEMLDWIEEKQALGEWISNAIHWDGRHIRACVAAEMKDESTEVSDE